MAGEGNSRWYQSNYFAVGLALILCLGCLALACSVPMTISVASEIGPRSSAINLIPLCAWAHQGQVGLWWNSNVAPGGPIYHSPRFHAVCVAAPWTTALPRYGRPSFNLLP